MLHASDEAGTRKRIEIAKATIPFPFGVTTVHEYAVQGCRTRKLSLFVVLGLEWQSWWWWCRLWLQYNSLGKIWRWFSKPNRAIYILNIILS